MKRIRPESKTPRILYAGDDDLDRAAVYLSTILFTGGFGVDYVPSPSAFPASIDPRSYALIILSDYPRKNFAIEQERALADAIRGGASLLMIGGWESFSGLQREYVDSPIADVLPVTLIDGDDRRNFSQGCIPRPEPESLFASALPWEHPPIIGGLNEIRPRSGAQVQLWGDPLQIRTHRTPGGERGFQASCSSASYPLLVSSHIGRGFAAALAFDLAPHWVGGFVDWGETRIRLDWEDRFIEVGELYHRFVHLLMKFCLTKGTQAS